MWLCLGFGGSEMSCIRDGTISTGYWDGSDFSKSAAPESQFLELLRNARLADNVCRLLIGNSQFSESGAQHLSDALASNAQTLGETLHTLQLTFCAIDVPGWKRLSEVLPSALSNLPVLQLWNSITDQTAQYAGELLARLRVQSLSLTAVRFDTSRLVDDLLFIPLTSHVSLHTIDLSCCTFVDVNRRPQWGGSGGSGGSTDQKTAPLSPCAVSDGFARVFAHPQMALCTLRIEKARATGMTVIDGISRGLGANKSLTVLSLCDVGLTDAGCIALALALALNSTLRVLEIKDAPNPQFLFNPLITDEGGIAIVSALDRSRTPNSVSALESVVLHFTFSLPFLVATRQFLLSADGSTHSLQSLELINLQSQKSRGALPAAEMWKTIRVQTIANPTPQQIIAAGTKTPPESSDDAKRRPEGWTPLRLHTVILDQAIAAEREVDLEYSDRLSRCCLAANNKRLCYVGGLRLSGLSQVLIQNFISYWNQYLNWSRAAVVIAFHRANFGHRFSDSILALLPSIVKLMNSPLERDGANYLGDAASATTATATATGSMSVGAYTGPRSRFSRQVLEHFTALAKKSTHSGSGSTPTPTTGSTRSSHLQYLNCDRFISSLFLQNVVNGTDIAAALKKSAAASGSGSNGSKPLVTSSETHAAPPPPPPPPSLDLNRPLRTI